MEGCESSRARYEHLKKIISPKKLSRFIFAPIVFFIYKTMKLFGTIVSSFFNLTHCEMVFTNVIKNHVRLDFDEMDVEIANLYFLSVPNTDNPG